jgi:hypothetical protein
VHCSLELNLFIVVEFAFISLLLTA